MNLPAFSDLDLSTLQPAVLSVGLDGLGQPLNSCEAKWLLSRQCSRQSQSGCARSAHTTPHNSELRVCCCRQALAAPVAQGWQREKDTDPARWGEFEYKNNKGEQIVIKEATTTGRAKVVN